MRRRPSSLPWLGLIPTLLLLSGWNSSDPAILLRGVDAAFAHPMFHSYNTYPTSHGNNHNNPAAADEGGGGGEGSPTVVFNQPQAPHGSTRSSSSSPPPQFVDPTNSHQLQQQIMIQELQQQVSTLLSERQQLHNELKGLQHDYQVDVTALADRIEELLQLMPRTTTSTVQQNGYDGPRPSMRFEDDKRMHQEDYHPRPFLEFRARDGEDDVEEDDDQEDEDRGEEPDPLDAQLLALSTKGMLLTQRSSLRARLQNVANDVRSSLGGVFRRPEPTIEDNDTPSWWPLKIVRTILTFRCHNCEKE